MTILRHSAMMAALSLTCVASAAIAQQAAGPALAVETPSITEPHDAFAAAVADADLRKVTGRDDIGAIVASATQRNTVANNSVIGTSTTGSVRIDGNAFQNVQGLAVVSANSGNNVAINAAMNVTINMPAR